MNRLPSLQKVIERAAVHGIKAERFHETARPTVSLQPCPVCRNGFHALAVDDGLGIVYTCKGCEGDIAAALIADPEPVPVSDGEGFVTYTPAELLAMPKPEWLVEPFIKAGCITELFGPFGVYKTFLACSWAGEAPGAAVYVTAEGSPHDHGLTLRAWELAAGREADVASIPHAVNLLVDDDVERLLATFRGFSEKPRLLVVDTLARNMAGGNENAPDDMGRFVGAIDRLRKEFECAVLVIHHSGYEHADRSRGSSAWGAAVDVSVKIAKTDNKHQLEAKLTCSKMRGAARFDDRVIRLEPLHGTLVVVDAVAVDAALRRSIEEYLADHPAASQNEVERAVFGRGVRIREIYQEITLKVCPPCPTPGHTPDEGVSRVGVSIGTHPGHTSQPIDPTLDPDEYMRDGGW